MNDRIAYPCGCINEPQPPSGVLRNVARCPKHQGERRDPATLGESYYAECGLVRDGKPAPSRHVAELVEALGPLPLGDPTETSEVWGKPVALEVGCGASPYVREIESAGYEYVGLDLAPWACRWVTDTFGVRAIIGDLSYPLLKDGGFGLILCAHAFEHMLDAPRAIRCCAELMAPGGELWAIVPDDSDPVNPDHNWFFDERTLGACVEDAGLEVVEMAVRRHVEREQFVYARARKR